MTGNDPSDVVHDVQTLLSVGAVGALTDGQLLERFATQRDSAAEAAFAALVQRHGRMVWGVCRRILNDPHAAADAFQATFLVLVRKASTVRVDDSLGRWLYGVSRRVAMRAKVTSARRSSRELEATAVAVGADDASDRSELLAELDKEVGRLPERYRAAVVLCDLGAMSHEEAARQMGCAVGTVGSRLVRGRERLRDRLVRRGLAPSTAMVVAGLSAETARAALVPVGLVDATARAAVQVAAGDAALITANVSALAKGTLKAMFSMRLMRFAAALAFLPAAGLIVLSYGAAPEAVPPAEVTAAPAAVPSPAVDEKEPAGESPQQIIARMTDAYGDARSYEDEGEVTLVFIGAMGKRTVTRPFFTKFVRPNLFHYEFTDRDGAGEGNGIRFVIWTDAALERSKTWWTLEPKIKEGTLGLAIGAGVGISGGSSFTVPNLLMPNAVPGAALAGLNDPKVVGEEAVDGFPCDKVEGRNGRGATQTVWVDKTTSLVRKIFLPFTIPGMAVEQTTTYRPRLNEKIARELFEFVPPKP